MKLARAAVAAIAIAGCTDGATGPDDLGPCTVDSVDVSVSIGTTPTFTWTPACRVILLLVEQGATDQWLLEATGEGIASGVTYGTVPAGATADEPATPLQAGTTYEIILFRGPAGSEVMIALEEFTP